MSQRPKILKSESGNIILSFIIIIVLGISLTLLLFSSKTSVEARLRHMIRTNNLDAVRSSILSALYNRLAIDQMLVIGVNGDLNQCLRNPAFDCPNVTSPLQVLLPDSSTLIGISPQEGIRNNVDATGTYRCTNFMSGGILCPLKYNLVWFPQCPAAGPCLRPTINIQGRLVFDPAVNLVLNPSRYSIDFSLD